MSKRPEIDPFNRFERDYAFAPDMIVLSNDADAKDALLEFPAEAVLSRPTQQSPVTANHVVPPPVHTRSRGQSLTIRRGARSMIWLTAALVACALGVWMASYRSDRGDVTSPHEPPDGTRPILASARVLPPVDPIAPAAIHSSLAVRLRPAAAIERTAASPRRRAPVNPLPAGKAPAETASRPSFHGTLIVNSEPAGARVIVNGKRVGSTPVILAEMPAGSRVVRIEADGYAAWSGAVRVVANQETRIAATLHR